MIPMPDASPGFCVFVEANLNDNGDEPSISSIVLSKYALQSITLLSKLFN